MALENKGYRQAMAKEEGFTRQKAMTLGTVFSKGFSVAMGLGLVHGFKTVGGMLTSLITTAAKTETLDVAMQAVARSSGYPIPVLQQQRKEVMALGIAEQEATQTMTRFMQAQLDTADASRTARVAQDAGTVASMNSSEALAQMTEAIAKLRPELLTAFGFTRNLNDIYKDYAGTVGKTSTQLSEIEKKQAMLNYIFKEGEKIAGAYDMAMGTVGKKMGSLEKLELSKKLMQELKTALAQPLLLPAFGYWVDMMTTSFERAKAWVEANQATLISWGQTAQNVLENIVRGVQWVSNAFIRNWGIIRFAATAFISYLVLSKTLSIARAAALAFSIALSVLRGQSVITSGAMGILSGIVQHYQATMAMAPIMTNAFTASLYRLAAAAGAVWSALGPVGWIILLISGLVAGGMALWNKYTGSVRAANEAAREAKMKKLADQQAAAAKAATKAVKGENRLADAIKKAGAAAAKTLLPFDEIHTIQKSMAGVGDVGGMDIPVADIPDYGIGAPDMGDFVGGFMDAFDDIKPTFKGFLEWLWQGWSDWVMEYIDPLLGGVVDWLLELPGKVRQGWKKFLKWAGNMWKGVVAKWDSFKTWAGNLWDGVLVKWENFKTWCRETWAALWDPVRRKWDTFKTWAGDLWETVKTKWNNFRKWARERWNAFFAPIKERWLTFRNWARDAFAPVREKWATFTTWARGIWTRIRESWDKMKKWKLWTWIKNKVNWLKNIFDFKWSLPKIKTPKFKVTWDKGGYMAKVGEYFGLPGVPKLSVTWLAKGGILTRPTLFGLGGGEAGREAVLPLDSNTGWIDELAAKLKAAGGGGDNGPLIFQIHVGSAKILEEIIDAAERKNDRAGRTVVQVGV